MGHERGLPSWVGACQLHLKSDKAQTKLLILHRLQLFWGLEQQVRGARPPRRPHRGAPPTCRPRPALPTSACPLSAHCSFMQAQ